MKNTFVVALLFTILLSACKTKQKAATAPPPPPATPGMVPLEMEEVEEEDPIFEIVEEMPQFPGGNTAMTNYLRSNLRYPAEDKKNGTEGTSFIQFVVLKTGEISEVKVFDGARDRATEAMHAEAIRIISNMPNWKPGTQKGEAVSVRYLLPIKFTLR